VAEENLVNGRNPLFFKLIPGGPIWEGSPLRGRRSPGWQKNLSVEKGVQPFLFLPLRTPVEKGPCFGRIAPGQGKRVPQGIERRTEVSLRSCCGDNVPCPAAGDFPLFHRGTPPLGGCSRRTLRGRIHLHREPVKAPSYPIF